MAKVKILVVEDEAITAKDIQNRLKELGYDVPAITSSGEGAIKKVEEIKPDLVLMDIVLKGDMDGIEAAEQIRDRFDVPVVYVTAYIDEEWLKKIKVSEPYGYITKPFWDKELRPTIEMALQRHTVEKALRESEEKYRTLVESINDIVFTLDGKGKFTYLSPRFEVATGYRPQDLIGHSFTEVLAPEYIESTVDSFRRGLSGETIPLYEVELLLRDGRRHPLELNVSSILDAERQPIGRLGIARDISERKKMEDKLLRSEALYRSIFEATRVPTVILNEDGTFYRVNAEAAKISGFTKEEMEGKKSWTEFITEKEDLEMMQEIHQL